MFAVAQYNDSHDGTSSEVNVTSTATMTYHFHSHITPVSAFSST